MSLKKKLELSNSFYKNSEIWIGIAIIVSVVVAVVFLKSNILSRLSKEATLFLAFENNNQGRMFRGEVIEGMTIFDTLIASSEAGDIRFRYMITPESKVDIIELDGYVKGDPRELTFYINEKRVIAENINSTVVRPGDSVEVQLE